MKRSVSALLISLLCWLKGNAQLPEKLLGSWADRSPIEKAYLHTDRENYIAGETIWFKAYLTSDFYPDTISTTLYVELVNITSKNIDRKIVPVFWGAARGQLDIPDSLSTGNYIIRAYTATMLNQATDFVFRKNIFIYGKKTPGSPSAIVAPKMLRVEFFPEGGNLVNGLLSAVAFKATDENGLPVEITGSFHSEKEELDNIKSYHDGMGLVEFTPVPGEKYYLLIDGHPLTKYYLPAATDKGIALAIVTNQRELLFDIQQSADDPAFRPAYIIGQMQHRVIFRQDLPADRQILRGQINTTKLNSGIMQVTVFNRDGMPLAERLCFINNREYMLEGQLLPDTISFAVKGRNRFSLSLKDTVQGTFSVAITDPDYDILQNRETNIFSSLLLTSDIKGYVHNPNWYFSTNSDSSRRAADLVMMTNGWRRFKWDELAKSKLTEKKYNDLAYISIAGRANLLDSKRPFAEKEMLITIYNPDSTNTFQVVNTDAAGNFRIDSMFFWGKTRLLFSDTRGKKSQFIEVELTADSLARVFPLVPAGKQPSAMTDSMAATREAVLAMDFDAIQKAAGILLEGVTVKGKRKKTPTEELEEKYVSGLFAGMSDQTLDLVNTTEPLAQRNIFEYLQGRVPSISIQNSGAAQDVVLYYRGGATTSFLNPPAMLLYLDEMRADAVTISNLRPSDIALVKVYSHFVGAPGNGVGGVLSIYTRKKEDMKVAAEIPAAHETFYNGYSVTKEFYSPDYIAEPAEKSKTDNRITLQWVPDLFVNDVNPTLPLIFYNNDRSKKFKVVIEGMTINGKMLMIEKIISPKPF